MLAGWSRVAARARPVVGRGGWARAQAAGGLALSLSPSPSPSPSAQPWLASPRRLHTSACSSATASTSASASALSSSSSTAAPSSSSSSSPSPSSGVRAPSIVLGVETSCDDTAMALVGSNGEVLSSACASQWHLFDQFRGVQPLSAAHAHQDQLQAVFEQVLAKAGLAPEAVEAVAVTAGPGMAPCLKVGLTWASTFARERRLPFVGVHHMQAHAAVAGLDHPQLRFPYLALLISGGHTELWLVESLSKVTILAETVDDAIGEAFDKAARLIGVSREQGSPGAAVEKLARGQVQTVHTFPELSPVHMDFSFSGLKSALQRKVFEMRLHLAQQQQQQHTAADSAHPSPSSEHATLLPSKLVNRDIQQLVREFKHDLFRDVPGESRAKADGPSLALPPLPLQDQIDLCAAFQSALIAQLCSRTLLAVRHCRSRYPALQLSQLVVAGGVACNSAVRAALQATVAPYHLEVLSPRPLHCTDNGIMIAHLGRQLLLQGHTDSYDLCFVTRWPIGDKEPMARVKEQRRGPDLRQVDQQANGDRLSTRPTVSPLGARPRPNRDGRNRRKAAAGAPASPQPVTV